jgi:SAM-dependent methyltransferase
MAPLIRPNAVVLDVGCGDGLLTQSILDLRPDLIVGGFDVHVPPRTYVRVRHFDGRTLPHGNESVDVVILADVLHHAEDPIRLLFETARVARHTIIIKDRVQKAGTVGRYWTAGEWTLGLQRVGIPIESWNASLGLYPWPASVLFDRSLHFVARLGAGSSLRRT